MVFVREKHIKFFQRCLRNLPCACASMDEMRMTLAYFAVSGLDLLHALYTIEEDRNDIIEWIYSLQVVPDSDGSNLARCGFRGSLANGVSGAGSERSEFDGSHIAMTYTALATLVILGDDLSRVDKRGVTAGLRALQQKTGSFCAVPEGSEDDMRFVYCAACISYILQDWSGLDVERSVRFVENCYCYDGSISHYPGTEGHGGSTFCAVAALVLMGKLHAALDDRRLERLCRWCLLRQRGGFQGRPNKPVDTCYSFWLGAALKMLGMYQFVNGEKNLEFLESTQDEVTGGFGKWPDSEPDPMHAYMGVAGMSLMGVEGVAPLEPALNMSQRAATHLRSLHRSRPEES